MYNVRMKAKHFLSSFAYKNRKLYLHFYLFIVLRKFLSGNGIGSVDHEVFGMVGVTGKEVVCFCKQN